jgi:hypothetical protein
MKQDDPLSYLGIDFSTSSLTEEDLLERVASLKDRMSEFGYISRETREKLAEKAKLFPMGPTRFAMLKILRMPSKHMGAQTKRIAPR